MQFRTVYVTVGTTKFDALIKKVTTDAVLDALEDRGCVKLILQHGNSTPVDEEKIKYIHQKYVIRVEQYNFRPNIEDIRAADMIIGHAGAGTCMDILNNGKPGLIVINDELMDNHQIELARQLASEQYLYYCKLNEMSRCLVDLDFRKLMPYENPDENPKENMQKFVDAMNDLMTH